MELYQLRVIDEKVELDIKIQGLENFLKSDQAAVVNSSELVRMRDQLYYMQEYSNILADRITAFS